MFRCTPLSLTLALGDYPSQFYRKNFHKSHQFEFVNNVALLAEGNRPKFDGNLMYDVKCEPSLHPRSKGSQLVPAWRVYEKQMLRFFGYFKDTLTESKTPYQIRQIKLIYYLEDDTIQITESRSDSGIIKGCLVSRQRIKKAAPFNFENISLLDLNVNQTIRILDRIYHLTECDIFTRSFLQRLGISVPNPVEIPLDPTTEIRRREKESMVPKHPFPKDFRFAQFLENDRKVLRFSGYWDDTNCENGDIRMLDVLYHLADDTVEIKEKLPVNSGRHSNGMFLRRGKLPRAANIREVGDGNFSVLNVLGRGMKGRYLRDRLEIKSADEPSKYYNERDLSIGRVISVFGRSVFLVDCDGQTREFYRKKYGVEEFHPMPIPIKSSIKFVSYAPQQQAMPPYNGWGSYEDSEGNCLGIEPKTPKTDFKKFLNYDKLILRFGAKMISNIRENNDRVFNISYHLADDTISVFELPCRNFGFVAGEFIGKTKCFLPGQGKFTSQRPIPYVSQHFYLGATVILRDFCFKIVSADLFALKFMEDRKELYPMSHASIILTKVRDALRPIYKEFISRYMTQVRMSEKSGIKIEYILYEDFKNFLKDLLMDAIVEHEVVTLCRYFAIETKDSMRAHRETVRSIVQGEILRELWDDLDRTKEAIYHLSPDNICFLSEEKILTIVRGCRIPLDIMIVRQMFEVLNRNENNEIEVKDFLEFVDLKKCKASPVPPVNPKINQFHFETNEGSLIDWKHFISSVGLEEELQICGN